MLYDAKNTDTAAAVEFDIETYVPTARDGTPYFPHTGEVVFEMSMGSTLYQWRRTMNHHGDKCLACPEFPVKFCRLFECRTWSNAKDELLLRLSTELLCMARKHDELLLS